MNAYKQMKDRHQKQLNDFPIMFAFSNKQFDEGMKKLELEKDQTNMVLDIGNGGFIKKDSLMDFDNMFERQEQELKAAIESDQTGEGFILEMFRYELGNHEYSYTYDLSDTLQALDLSMTSVNERPNLKKGLELAIKSVLEEEY
ncbi:hypothetical protein EVJ32_04685 [Exiguobacterium sp. SH5S4]|uniref:DUF7659 family protein n=1 Tax=Exiguobacterium sp. SH5S4 TaxID=2510961 RepID=UPI00103F371E|nr:hypothetical protein [Exiguobacterium sp. SH5S4]TCI26674.1 hypothetical protein EVJ32_04685 [Exiguobacterium sp. SH5S4]